MYHTCILFLEKNHYFYSVTFGHFHYTTFMKVFFIGCKVKLETIFQHLETLVVKLKYLHYQSYTFSINERHFSKPYVFV